MLYLLFLPSEYLSETKIWSYDKLGHAALFGVWSMLYWFLRRGVKTNFTWLFMETMVISLGFGAAVEILQYFLPINRGAEFLDFVADAVGTGISLSVCKRFFSFPNKKAL